MMAVTTVVFQIGSGADARATNGEVLVERFEPGWAAAEPDTWILDDGGLVPLSTVAVERQLTGGAYYWFTPRRPAGKKFVAQIPLTGPVRFGDLVPLDPATLTPTATLDPAWLAQIEGLNDELAELITELDTSDSFVASQVLDTDSATAAALRETTRPAPVDRVMFVTPRGNDANDGLSIRSAKLTLDAAVTALEGATGVIQCGYGTIEMTAGIATPPAGLIVQGSGRGGTFINYTGSGAAFKSSTPGVRAYNVHLRDFTLAGPGKTATGTVGIDLDSLSESSLRDVVVHSFETGVKIRSAVNGGATYNRFFNTKAQNCTYGFDIAASGSNGNDFYGCRANACTTGVRIVDSNNATWMGGQIEACTTGILVDATGPSLADANAFIGTRFETNTTAWSITANVRTFQMLFPQPFGTYTFSDLGQRTQHIRADGDSRVSQAQSANGSYRYERSANGGAETPAVVFKDSNTSSGTPVTHQIETERPGFFSRGKRGGVTYYSIDTSGNFIGLSVIRPLSVKTASYTLLAASDSTVVFNGTGLTATLPSPSVAGTGRQFVVKNINSSALTVASAGGGTIDGASTQSLAQWAKATYVSDGANWLSI